MERPLLKLIFVFLIALSVAFCQTAFKRPAAEQIVRKMLSDPMRGYSSWEEKDLNKLGDASAVVATKVLDGKTLSVNEIRQALLIVEFSFEAPNLIEVESDRQPKAASILVDKLRRMPAASGLKEDFHGTKKVLAAARKANAH